MRAPWQMTATLLSTHSCNFVKQRKYGAEEQPWKRFTANPERPQSRLIVLQEACRLPHKLCVQHSGTGSIASMHRSRHVLLPCPSCSIRQGRGDVTAEELAKTLLLISRSTRSSHSSTSTSRLHDSHASSSLHNGSHGRRRTAFHVSCQRLNKRIGRPSYGSRVSPFRCCDGPKE